ncbi:PucR family transcriptional regulator [Streptomyces sp. NBC_01257]|uniref:PucR family transcriptional regulator n=1 Tax=Streptomyces sp. NBC_01257 TaxID=2903799 RepID=UPI002DD9F018|nr:PucR family transcriptional regulator [Streptomyces sp. NBC_01257]WRZ63631.1 PucR family transcriptional regulator [Streptomyces sp. NBC_01257]
MHVEHLLRDETLGLRLLWAEEALLDREISGVTVTDLEGPARFVRPGEAVLSGLVWWTPDSEQGRTERFVAGLRSADAAVLLAGEETHGSVPDDLIEACVRHRIPLAAVPAHVMFRAVTDKVYLQQWGELSRHHALPENARNRLSHLAAQGGSPEEVVTAAFTHLGQGAVAYVLTATGRTVAATPGAPGLPLVKAAALLASGTGARVPVDTESATTPYKRWHLYLPDPGTAPPRMLHEVAAVLGRCQEQEAQRETGRDRAAAQLGLLLTRDGAESATVVAAMRSCGLPTTGESYRVATATTGVQGTGPAEDALSEAVAQVAGTGPTVVGRLPDGTAFAVALGTADGLGEVWPRVAACEPSVPLHGGTGAPAAGPQDLAAALAEARFALASAQSTAPRASLLVDASSLTGLEALLTGIPAEVRTAFSRTVLGSLLDSRSASAAPLLHTLRTFLDCDGSWARTAEVLHLHVNTVHYRIRRTEHFTGRDLSRLADRLDLWAALLCHKTVPSADIPHGPAQFEPDAARTR